MRPNNPNYLVEIKRHGEQNGSIEQGGNNPQNANNNTVIAYLPQTFSYQIQSDWEPALANMVQGFLGENITTAAASMGMRLNDKILTAQIWRSTEPLDLSLTLLFDAIKDTQRDVIDPIKRLTKWSVPGRMGGNDSVANSILEAPGPSLQNFINNPDKNRTSIRIGRMFYFDNVIIPSLGVTWVTAPDGSGKFIGAEVELTFRTFFTPDIADIMRYFIEGNEPDTNYNEFTEIAKGREETLRRIIRGVGGLTGGGG
jgi:hypothetical protein